MIQMNEVLERLPRHLLDLVIEQPYNEYTPQDHAVWRFVMRQNLRYLSKVAHPSYISGLEKTGISIDRIPHMYGMNRILKEIGWAAVAVDGFIPPSAFMEFQAYNVLVIAADIRPIDQVEYTPAPDIIHEAAGHAPIIADRDYSEYLREFGRIGSKAFSSAKDHEIYEAVRHLSILKADPYTKAEEIRKAEEDLKVIEQMNSITSEMTQIRNLHWWTVEYGLIGDLKKPKIYGAGLLSSIGESYSSLQDDVKKLPYTLEAVNFGFDITTRQPQLFVTPDFKHLNDVLHEYAREMALYTGGVDGLLKAIDSNSTATCVMSSGLQVSGTFSEVIIKNDEVAYFRTDSPTSLCFNDKELQGHGKEHHHHGFGSPAGKLKDISTPLEMLSDGDLSFHGIEPGKIARLEFESGVAVIGNISLITRKNGKVILITFDNCKVTFRDRVLFDPSWGIYDMAVGEKIISAYAGPADPDSFGLRFSVPGEKTHKIEHTPGAKHLHSLYQSVRDIRENGKDIVALNNLWNIVRNEFPEEWLLPLEILEVVETNGLDRTLASHIHNYLLEKKEQEPGTQFLINNGLEQIYGRAEA